MLGSLLRHLEAGMPIARSTKALIRERSPDVVVVSQGIVIESPELEVVRSAQAAKTPSVLVMSGIDGADPAQIRDIPTLTLVAEQEQANDVVEAYEFPRDRIQAMGGETSRGRRLPSPSGVAEAAGEASGERVAGPPGTLMRPVLWLLTPLLLLTLLLLHPVATSKDGVAAIRRTGKQVRARRRKAAKVRAGKGKGIARSTGQEKRARSEAATQRKAARAQEKQRKRERRGPSRGHPKAARRKERARASVESEEARTEA
jgi:hypothetical protein